MLNNYINMRKKPYAFAIIRGSNSHPGLNGRAWFFRTPSGILVSISLKGLPKSDDVCKQPIFAAHIHKGNSCTGNMEDPFGNAMTHYNPYDCEHPYHAGDMPPIFGVDGLGFTMFLTDRFSAEEIIGKTVIIHANLDDFTTQPSGNSGAKIACGTIVPL